MITPKQLKVARLFLDWDQQVLAEKTDLSVPTIQRMEKLGLERSSMRNVEKVRKVLEAEGIEFIGDEAREGVAIRKKRSQPRSQQTR